MKYIETASAPPGQSGAESPDSSEQSLTRISSTLLNKLRGLDTPKREINGSHDSTDSPTALQKKQYDIMLSYSHRDKELCHRILKKLEGDKYSVWIDIQEINGATYGSIAHAIENSEFVLICASDNYKQSGVCEEEANYARNRCCLIIPLFMTLGYRPDGWLGLLTASLNHVDILKRKFEDSYKILTQEINLRRKNRTQLKPTKSGQVHSGHSLPMDTRPKKEVQARENNDIRRFQ